MILGVLAMAGNGSRLAMPFPKPLMPVPDGERIRPLYTFAEERLAVVADSIARIVAPYTSDRYPMPVREAPLDESSQPDCYRIAARAYAADDDLVAIALPDTIWFPEDGFAILRDELAPDDDGIVGLFASDGRVLDEVRLDDSGHVSRVTYHGPDDVPPFRVVGWGALLIRAHHVKAFAPGSNMVDNLRGLRLGAHHFNGPFWDLGTPERWLRYVRASR